MKTNSIILIRNLVFLFVAEMFLTQCSQNQVNFNDADKLADSSEQIVDLPTLHKKHFNANLKMSGSISITGS